MSTSTTTLLTVARYAADTTPEDRAWWSRGICSDAPDPDAWHPADDDTDDLSTRWAIRICQQCPVRTQCRDYALARSWITGIWGGTTTDGRNYLRRNHRRKPA